MIIPPALAPTKNQPVILPVMVIRRSARESVVGKMEAIKRPSPKAPDQILQIEVGQIRIKPTLIKQLRRSIKRMKRGLKRAAIGMERSRPRASPPQKAPVR